MRKTKRLTERERNQTDGQEETGISKVKGVEKP